MAREVIRLGDNTSHGGRVIEATARMTIDGIPVALWGHKTNYGATLILTLKGWCDSKPLVQ